PGTDPVLSWWSGFSCLRNPLLKTHFGLLAPILCTHFANGFGIKCNNNNRMQIPVLATANPRRTGKRKSKNIHAHTQTALPPQNVSPPFERIGGKFPQLYASIKIFLLF